MSDIFREVDEDVRRDRATQLWKRFGPYVIGAAILIVVIAIAIVAWRDYQARTRISESDRYIAAARMAAMGEIDPAARGFGSLAQDARGGYALLARLREAAVLADAGRNAEAVATYESVARDSAVPNLYRQFAELMAVMHSLDTADADGLVARLEPLTQAGAPWRATALELRALAALRAGDVGAARQDYAALADGADTPQSLRARAAEMLAALPADGQ